MAFNPLDHLISLKGRDYLQVAWRLVWFREKYPGWSIAPELLEKTEDYALFRAVISDENGVVKNIAHGSETKRDFADFLEKAETKAVGRALAMLGFGTQFAAEELDEGERVADAPLHLGSTDAAERVGLEKLEKLEELKRTAQKPATVPADAIAPGQLAFIRENAEPAEITKLVQKYGPNLEKMTRAQAEKNIAILQKRLNNGGVN